MEGGSFGPICVIVETDGYQTDGTRQAFVRDAAATRYCSARMTVVRVSWDDVFFTPTVVAGAWSRSSPRAPSVPSRLQKGSS